MGEAEVVTAASAGLAFDPPEVPTASPIRQSPWGINGKCNGNKQIIKA